MAVALLCAAACTTGVDVVNTGNSSLQTKKVTLSREIRNDAKVCVKTANVAVPELCWDMAQMREHLAMKLLPGCVEPATREGCLW